MAKHAAPRSVDTSNDEEVFDFNAADEFDNSFAVELDADALETQNEGSYEQNQNPLSEIEKAEKSKKRNKIIACVCGGVVLLLALVYAVGAFYFSSHFVPRTTLAGADVSFKSPEEVHDQLVQDYATYSLTVSGYDYEQTITGESISFAIDENSNLLTNQNQWKWPLALLQTTDASQCIGVTYDEELLNTQVDEALAAHNESAISSVDAQLVYDADKKAIVIAPESYGTCLDAEKTRQAIVDSLVSLEPTLELPQDCLVPPNVFSDDEGLQKELSQAQQLSRVDVELLMGGFTAAYINGASVLEFMTVDENHNVSLSDEAINAWASDLAQSLNTLGSERTYTRPDGKVCTVSGGTWGWQVNVEDLQKVIVQAIRENKTGQIEVPSSGTANYYDVETGVDWGKRYIDVDLSEQYARFYDDDGNCAWETDIISGNVNISGRETPTGVYYITRMTTNELLKTYEPGKEKPVETTVAYWMPFISNVYALHDAWWQPGFGGDMYRNGYGSHGCVNLPSSKAAELYGLISVGDVCVVHW